MLHFSGAQALRGSLLKKYAKIRTEIDRLHNSRMSPYEKTEALEAIRSHIMAAWRTDEIRRTKPSPQVLQHVLVASICLPICITNNRLHKKGWYSLLCCMDAF